MSIANSSRVTMESFSPDDGNVALMSSFAPDPDLSGEVGEESGGSLLVGDEFGLPGGSALGIEVADTCAGLGSVVAGGGVLEKVL
jgi:hypothetical protein